MNINKNIRNQSNNSAINESASFAWFKARVTEDHSFDVDCASENCHSVTGVSSSLLSDCFSNFTSKILPDFRQKFMHDLSEALKTKSHLRTPVPVSCENHNVLHLDFKAAPVGYDKHCYYFCILTSDAAKTEHLPKNKQKLLDMLIHELRHPLTGILSSVDIMRHNRRTNSEDSEDYLKVIAESGEALLCMVDDILEYSQSISMYRENIETLVDLNHLFIAARNLVQTTISEKAIAFLKMRSHNPVPELIRTHPKRLTQIINNLLSNAVKYTNHGTICLEILGCEPIAEGYNLVFSVRDTGIGMSEATQQKIFEPFFRGDVGASGNPGGSGLGLYIVKELVDSLQGTITCRSQLGVGTEFLVQVVVHNP